MIGRLTTALAAALLVLSCAAARAADEGNEFIDYAAFEKQVIEVGKIREKRRISEAQFLRMAREPGTLVLDARSAGMFQLLHIKGAKNLSLPDMTEEELAKVIPSKSTRVLIYCNNNFRNEKRAFPTKVAPASLNLHTFNALYSYGYRNVYELGPLIDINTAKFEFEGAGRQLMGMTVQ
jgi:phage shock protein E